MSDAVADVFFPSVSSTLLQLRDFLGDQVERFQPDLVLVVERKGTAVYRAVLERDPSALPGWERVISTSALSALPDSELRGRRLLIFDDMLRQGNEIRKVLDQLMTREVTDSSLSNVHVAAFATHEDAGTGRQFGQSTFPHAVFHRNLSHDAYRSIRSQVVSALQEAGSLMLDTEHIELRVEQRAPLSDIARALSRSGTVVAFQSAGSRTNITVYYDDQTAADPKPYPPGTRLRAVVRKCRLVERSPGEFALIPIYLPDVPKEWGSWSPLGEDVPIFGPSLLSDSDVEDRFQAVALRASLEPLALAVRDLFAAGPGVVGFDLPQKPAAGASTAGYDLSHLHVVYPALDLGAVHARVTKRFSQAKANGSRLARKKWPGGVFVAPEHGDLRETATALLQRIAALCDTRAAERQNGGVRLDTAGLRLGEVMAAGETAGIAPHYVSACLDFLIDEAMLITDVELLEQDGAGHSVRTYRPDGEVASEQVRDFTRRHGLLRAPGLP